MSFGKDKKTSSSSSLFGSKSSKSSSFSGSPSIRKNSLDVGKDSSKNISKFILALLPIVLIAVIGYFLSKVIDGKLSVQTLRDVVNASENETNPARQILEEKNALKEKIEMVKDRYSGSNINTMLVFYTSALAGEALEKQLLNYAYFLNNDNYNEYLTYKSVYKDIIVDKGNLRDILLRFQHKEVSAGNDIPLGFLYYNELKNKTFMILKKYEMKNQYKENNKSVKQGFVTEKEEPGCYMYMFEGNYLEKKYITELVRTAEVIPYDIIDTEICRAFF